VEETSCTWRYLVEVEITKWNKRFGIASASDTGRVYVIYVRVAVELELEQM